MKRFRQIFWFLGGLLLFKTPEALSTPRLSSDKPIRYDAKKRASIAEGNAEFLKEGFRLQADKIYYFAEEAKALAEGHVRITNGEYRVLSPGGAYWHVDQKIEAKAFRMALQGHGVRGENLRGITDSRLVADHVVLDNRCIHDRDLVGLHVKARQGVVAPKRYVLLKDAVVHLGFVPILVVPVYRHSLEESFVRWKSECTLLKNKGYKKKPNETYGNYWRNDISFLPKWPVRPTIMLDYYRKQGVFTGIKAEYDDKWGYSQRLGKGEVELAGIHDEALDECNRNTKGHPIQNSRYWFSWKHQGHIGESNDLAAHVQWMRDPDVIKVFRPAWNDGTKQHPDNFVELSHRQENAVISGLFRYKLNRFQRIQERLPEIRYEHAPVPIGSSNFYHQYGFGFSNLRECPLDKEDTEQFQEVYEKEEKRISRRIDASYGLTFPLDLTPACTLTPLAQFRVAHYFKLQNKKTDRKQYTRWLEQFGFDLRFRSYGDFSYTNEYWDIHDFRHLLQPVLQYRYMPSGHAGNSFVPAVDRAAIETGDIPFLQEPDLLSQRGIDDCHPMHLMRLGIENTLFTNFQKGSGGRWMHLNAYQDFCFKQIQEDRKCKHTLSDTNVDFGWNPVAFFSFNEKICYSFPEKQLLSMSSGVSFSENDLWTFSLTHTYTPGNPKSKTRSKETSNQMTISTNYRINSTNTFSMSQSLDLRRTDITSQTYTWHTLIAKTWNFDTKFSWGKRKGWEVKLIYQFVSW